ncbi:MAG: hypothetical protein KAI66_11095, partial [Lentisphaeria bacterium]|nr:hypothetical protein [Lentisphaeria bacterium]
RKVRNELDLVRIAVADPELEDRLLAVERLVGQEAFKEVALTGNYLDARLKAVRRIQDQRMLAGIMCERKQPDLMMACFEGIHDPEILEEVAKDPRQSLTARRIAIDMFADRELLLDILRSVSVPVLRRAAVERIGDEALRKQLEEELLAHRPDEHLDRILETNDAEVVVEFLGAFRESPAAVRALGRLARGGGEHGEHASAILSRQLKHARAEIRMLALEGLRAADAFPPAVAEEMAGSDPDPEVRRLAGAALAGENA